MLSSSVLVECEAGGTLLFNGLMHSLFPSSSFSNSFRHPVCWEEVVATNVLLHNQRRSGPRATCNLGKSFPFFFFVVVFLWAFFFCEAEAAESLELIENTAIAKGEICFI